MLSWWVSIGSDEGRGSAFMARLLDGRASIRRSLPETAIGKQSMKLYKPNHRNARFAHPHVGAQRPVQQIGRAHVPPATNAHLVCRILLEKKKHVCNPFKTATNQ